MLRHKRGRLVSHGVSRSSQPGGNMLRRLGPDWKLDIPAIKACRGADTLRIILVLVDTLQTRSARGGCKSPNLVPHRAYLWWVGIGIGRHGSLRLRTKIAIRENGSPHVSSSSSHVLWCIGWGSAERGDCPVKRRHVDLLGDMLIVVVAGMYEGVRARHT